MNKFEYLDDANLYIEKLSLGKRIKEGSFSAIYNYNTDNYLLISIDKEKNKYLRKLYSTHKLKTKEIDLLNNLYGIIVPKLNEVKMNKTTKEAIYSLNKNALCACTWDELLKTIDNLKIIR